MQREFYKATKKLLHLFIDFIAKFLKFSFKHRFVTLMLLSFNSVILFFNVTRWSRDHFKLFIIYKNG